MIEKSDWIAVTDPVNYSDVPQKMILIKHVDWKIHLNEIPVAVKFNGLLDEWFATSDYVPYGPEGRDFTHYIEFEE